MRLTKKVSVGYNPAPQKYGSRAIYNKLGQLEDIEDELGIDLITLFRALKNGIWVKTKNGISFHNTIHIHKWQQVSLRIFYRPYTHLRIEDYGKTWALTKEVLK